ncbi:MAG: MFS transporter [Myxococcales bacterium]|nr:MFS transporter [Myxococcales bacterium]MCB9644223.1 MFS transporter [Myxococcales bacterium]
MTTLSWRQILAILWMVQFLVTMATTLGLTFIPFYLEKDPYLAVTSNTERIFYTSLILGGPFFTTLIATPFWGWMGDRTGRKKQVLRATIGLCITQLLMGFAITPMQLVLIRMLQGMISGVVAANLGLLSASTPVEHQGRAISILQSSNPVGLVLGPVVGGTMAYAFGFRQVYWLIGGVIFLAAIVSWRLLPSDAPKDAPKEEATPTENTKGSVRSTSNPFRDLYEALQRGWQNASLRVAFGILMLGNFAWSLSQAIFAIYADKLISRAVSDGQVASTWWSQDLAFTSICMSVTGVASFAMSFWWGRSHDEGGRNLMFLATTFIAVGSFLLVFWPPWWVVLVARFAMGGGLSGMSSLPYATISANVPSAERSKYMGLATSMIHLGNLGGFLFGGALARVWGESTNFTITATLCLLILIFSWPRLKPLPRLSLS